MSPARRKHDADTTGFTDGDGLSAGELAPYTSCSALGEETAFQAVLTGQEACRPVLRTDAPVHAEIFRIGFVPCALAAYPDRHDADYLTTEPGLFPDVLYPLEGRCGAGRRL